MSIDPLLALAGLLVGFVVGLTGMGGGALTTPLLVLVFGVQPLAAVSSDLVAAVVTKPVGGAVHLRRGTVNRQLVGLLALGSIPAAFSGALILDAAGGGGHTAAMVEAALGVALLAGALGIGARALTARLRPVPPPEASLRISRARAVLTVAIGVIGGLVVGLTSVGSGSIMIVLLMLLYPRLTTAQLVGTDLVQAVPLVGAAAFGHLLFGDVRLGLTVSLLIGSIPGVYIGARLSSRANLPLIRPILALVLFLSGAKLLGVGNVALALLTGAAIALALFAWAVWHHPRVRRSPAGQPQPEPATL